jgi:K319-like protein
MLAITVAAFWHAALLRAQLPMPASTVFEMTGFIQDATLDSPGDPFSGGTLTLNNHLIVIPRYTIFQMPATALTWTELFTKAPAPWGPSQTGLALHDTPKPDFTFEVTVQGNRVVNGSSDRHIAGLVFISNQSLQSHQGFISGIDYRTGELTVGGSRVRLNDPIGRFGRAMSHDQRFTIDEDNPTVKSETGYPMCIPRTDPASADDPLCPRGNRMAGVKIFTMGTPPPPSAAERQNPGTRTAVLDPWRAAPFQVGDYVTVKGPIVYEHDGSGAVTGQYLSAYAVDANVGIFTAPRTQPAYVSIDVVLMGTGPLNDATLAQEGAKRTRVEGFTTDAAMPVTISAVDVDPCTSEGTDRFWNMEAVDAGPPTGAVQGRWRFRPGAPLFDLKGFPFLPPTREVHAMSNDGTVITLNGLSAGEYTAPNFEFILPENLGVGTPVVPGNFETMAFLVQGSGKRGSGYTGQLSPWPGATPPVRNGCAVVEADKTATSATQVDLDGSESVAANQPTGGASYEWRQVSGTAVTVTNNTQPKAQFRAPTLAVGADNAVVGFRLTATPANGAPAVDSRTLTVTVTAPPDTVPPTVSVVATASATLTHGTATTLTATATDNVAVSGLTFFYSYSDAKGVKQTGTVVASKSATVANGWTAAFTPSVAGTYTLWAAAIDKAGNQTTGATTTRTVK